MPLNDLRIKAAKPKDKPYKLGDGSGLYLLVHPTGAKYWRLKYRYNGKEKKLAFGVYPEVSLADARARCMEARKHLAAALDPTEVKRTAKERAAISSANTFEAIALEWMEARKNAWTARYAEFMKRRLEADIFPQIGTKPIADITAPDLLRTLRIIEARGAHELAHRCKQSCGQIFMYAIATGKADRNPAADLQGALKSHVKKTYAHLKEVDLPEFLKKLEAYTGTPQTKLAVELLMLTFVRTTELRAMTWAEIDFDKAEWRIPAHRMKMRRDHIVPLSIHSLAILRELKQMNGHWQFVFPNPHKPLKHMSENAILYALYRMGYHNRTTGHGFRHTASTILNENGFNADHIERQLAHVDGNKIRGTYNHAQYLPERRKMMQWWADYIEKQSKRQIRLAA